MLVFKRRIAVWLVALALAILSAGDLRAQFVPYYGGYDGAWGAFGALTAAYSSAAQQRAYMQDRQLQASTTMARSAAWQHVNNTVAAENAARNRGFDDAGQSARDWVFARQPPLQAGLLAARSSAPGGAEAEPGPSPPPPVEAPAAGSPKEIMLWPTLLKTAPLTELRGQVEAPFRRAQADKQPLTADDYRSIVQALSHMKSAVVAVQSQVLPAEYKVVLDYLDVLMRDAQRRLDARLHSGEKPADR